jgi:hypothetical protein
VAPLLASSAIRNLGRPDSWVTTELAADPGEPATETAPNPDRTA